MSRQYSNPEFAPARRRLEAAGQPRERCRRRRRRRSCRARSRASSRARATSGRSRCRGPCRAATRRCTPRRVPMIIESTVESPSRSSVLGIASPSSSRDGLLARVRRPEVAVREPLQVAPELRARALVVAALVDDRLAHRERKPSADQVLRRIAERAEQEEVEDHDRGERRERDRIRRARTLPAHSSVHSGGSFLRRPLAMNVEAMIASDSSAEADQHRARSRQPAGVRRDRHRRAAAGARDRGRPGCSARICVIWKSGSPSGAGDGSQPCHVSLRTTSIAFRCTSGR